MSLAQFLLSLAQNAASLDAYNRADANGKRQILIAAGLSQADQNAVLSGDHATVLAAVEAELPPNQAGLAASLCQTVCPND